jgi:hypothetical protein
MSKTVKMLRRFGHKGQFVKYPSDWRPQMRHTGQRRFDTYCDLILGHCACGERHSEETEWVRDMLESHNSQIETHEEWLKRTRKVTAETLGMTPGPTPGTTDEDCPVAHPLSEVDND